MTMIFIEKAPDDGWRVKVKSDDPNLFKLSIDTLKSFIPANLRSYDPMLKEWNVVEAARDRLQRWLAYCGSTLHAEIQWLDAGEESEEEWVPPPPPPPRRRPTKDEAFKALHLLPTAPESVIKAAYRALAVEFHPDKPRGDTSKMQALNSAYTLLRDARR